jgi:hypothetical protein
MISTYYSVSSNIKGEHMFGHDDTNLPAPTGDNANDQGAPTDAPTAPSEPPTSGGNYMDELAQEPSDNSAPAAQETVVPSNDPAPAAPVGGDLLDIKQQALQALSPLLGHLDQTPEERFRTTMMMIQAADNQSLIPTAYEAAQQIGDEKTRAQALLDIVNEINYFTQSQGV